MKFIDEWVMCTEKYVLVQKMLTNWPPWAWVEKTVDGVETHWLSGKKKFHAQQLTKNVMLTVFWDLKGPITIDFLEKGTTVNSASYCQVLK